jgi:uncharacterized protein with HEPN domain
MRPEAEDLKSLWDMVDAARGVTALVAGVSLADYAGNRGLQWAVERGIEIIGEAARRVSPAFRERHPGVPWSAVIATRHILAHEYDDVQHDKVWRIATRHIPALVAEIDPILREHPPVE